jgi:hypothetical protein
MKRLRAAMLPVNFCTSFILRGGAISVMTRICLVLAYIPRLLTRNPSSCPDGTPKTHLFGFNFHFHLFRFSKVCFKSSISISGFFCLYYYVVDISFRIVTNLFTKTCLNSSLIGGAGVFESKGHGFIAICVESSDERCLALILFS